MARRMVGGSNWYHMTMTVGYAERLLREWQEEGKPQEMFSLNGEYLSYEDAFAFLELCRKEDLSFVPACDHTDVDGACLGHLKET